MSVRVPVDDARPRVIQTALVTSVDGNSWDQSSPASASTLAGYMFVDPITLSVMLRPQVLQPGWYAGATGMYARPALTDWTKENGAALTATDWIVNQFRFDGNTYLESLNVNYGVFRRRRSPRTGLCTSRSTFPRART